MRWVMIRELAPEDDIPEADDLAGVEVRGLIRGDRVVDDQVSGVDGRGHRSRGHTEDGMAEDRVDALGVGAHQEGEGQGQKGQDHDQRDQHEVGSRGRARRPWRRGGLW